MGFIPKTVRALRKQNKANIKDTIAIRLRLSPRRLTAAIKLINANLFAANLTNATFNDGTNPFSNLTAGSAVVIGVPWAKFFDLGRRARVAAMQACLNALDHHQTDTPESGRVKREKLENTLFQLLRGNHSIFLTHNARI